MRAVVEDAVELVCLMAFLTGLAVLAGHGFPFS